MDFHLFFFVFLFLNNHWKQLIFNLYIYIYSSLVYVVCLIFSLYDYFCDKII